ncbi:MAG: hypothetical protein AB7P23_00540 [Amphiplicatus sp.]
MRIIILAAGLVAVAAPTFAKESDTLKAVVEHGAVIKANMQGSPVELAITYKADGTYEVVYAGQASPGGAWRIDGDKLCTTSQMSGTESCTVYPAGKGPGDEFTVTSPVLGEMTVAINK